MPSHDQQTDRRQIPFKLIIFIFCFIYFILGDFSMKSFLYHVHVQITHSYCQFVGIIAYKTPCAQPNVKCACPHHFPFVHISSNTAYPMTRSVFTRFLQRGYEHRVIPLLCCVIGGDRLTVRAVSWQPDDARARFE